MIDFVIINGTDIEVSRAILQENKIGDFGRAISNKMLSDTTGVERVVDIQTRELPKADADALRAALNAAGTVTLGGTIVDDESPAPEFLARSVRVTPVSAADWIVSFQLYEAEP